MIDSTKDILRISQLKEIVSDMREATKDMSPEELIGAAQNEHIFALGSDDGEEAALHEFYSDIYRMLVNERNKEEKGGK